MPGVGMGGWRGGVVSKHNWKCELRATGLGALAKLQWWLALRERPTGSQWECMVGGGGGKKDRRPGCLEMSILKV